MTHDAVPGRLALRRRRLCGGHGRRGDPGDLPRHGRDRRHRPRGHAGRAGPCAGLRRARAGRLGGDGRGRAGAHPASRRRHHARPQPRPVGAGDLGHRQAPAGDAGGRRGVGGGRAGVLRRSGRRPVRAAHGLRRRLGLHDSPPLGRLRRHRGVELPHADRLLEGRARAGDRQRDGLQAVRIHPALRAEGGRDPARGGPCPRGSSTWCRGRARSALRW